MKPSTLLPLGKKELIVAGLVGTAAAGIGTLGEFLMMWSPDGGYATYENLLYASAERSTLGFFLGVCVVPLYFLGYLPVVQALVGVSRRIRLAILATAIYSFAAGNVWLGSRPILANLVKQGDQPSLVGLVTELTEPVLNLVRLLILLLSVALWLVIVTGRSIFPRWFALFTPGLLLGLVFLTYVLLPAVGNYLLPPAMNLVHLVFFATATWLYARSPETPQ